MHCVYAFWEHMQTVSVKAFKEMIKDCYIIKKCTVYERFGNMLTISVLGID